MKRRAMLCLGAAVIALIASITVGGVASARTKLLENGSFEWPLLKDGAVVRSFDAGEHLGRWRVTTGAVFITGAFPGVVTPPDGSQVVNLRPTPIPGPGGGEICQRVSTVPNGTYKIRFLAASIVGDSTIDVTLGGNHVARVDVHGAVPARFQRYAVHVVATTASALLCLRGHPSNDGTVPVVDAVGVTPVIGAS